MKLIKMDTGQQLHMNKQTTVMEVVLVVIMEMLNKINLMDIKIDCLTVCNNNNDHVP